MTIICRYIDYENVFLLFNAFKLQLLVSVLKLVNFLFKRQGLTGFACLLTFYD